MSKKEEEERRKYEETERDTLRRLYASSIGEHVLKYVDEFDPALLAVQVETAALSTLLEIKAVLDDPDLSDPSCFLLVDQIVSVFFDHNLNTERHIECE